MTDDLPDVDAAGAIESNERPLEGVERFFDRLGISENDYPHQRSQAVAHAKNRVQATDPAWRASGPRNIGGRIIAIAQDPADPLVLYVGSAQGGLWMTQDAGDTWVPLGEVEHVEPVGAIAIAHLPREPAFTSTLYVGTGSPTPSLGAGSGLYAVTVDRRNATAKYVELAPADLPGVAPGNAGLGRAERYTRIRVDPNDPARFWAASQTGLWRVEPTGPDRLILDFPPAGSGFPQRATGPPTPDVGWPAYCTDLVLAPDPRNTERLGGGQGPPRYLVLLVGIHKSGVYRGRVDRSTTPPTVAWETQLGVPNADLSSTGRSFTRIRLALCESRPSVVYAVFSTDAGADNPEHEHASFVFRSDDTGGSWKRRARIPRAVGWTDDAAKSGQADFCMVLEVDPADPDTLVCGEIDVCKSEDGARSWTPVLEWLRYDAGDVAQHADQHCALFDASDRRRLWVGNDGGVSLARNLRQPPQASRYWRKRSHGILAAQFYDVTTHPTLASFVGGGLQDNGSYVGFGGPTWYRVGGGDGGALAFHATAAENVIAGHGAKVTLATVLEAPQDRALLSPVPDIPAPNHTMYVEVQNYAIPGDTGPFIEILEQDPSRAGRCIAGWTASWKDSTAIAYQINPPGGFSPPAPTALTGLVADNPGQLSAPGAANPAIADGEETTAVAFGPLMPAVAMAAAAPPPAPPLVEGWLGTSNGHLVHAPNGAEVAGWVSVTTAPAAVGGMMRTIERIAVHPQDGFIVAVASNPKDEWIVLHIIEAGHTGVARFAVRRLGDGHVYGPYTTQTVVAVPLTQFVLGFSGDYAVGDAWTVALSGTVTTHFGEHVLSADTSLHSDLVIRIVSDGATGTATFSWQLGALPAAVATPTLARVSVPSTFTTLFFSGTFGPHDSWTVKPDGSVVTAAANAATGELHAVVSLGGKVHLSYDRGGTWQDISHPAPPPKRLSPDTDALPPGPVAALEWDRSVPDRLFAGTLAGVYVLSGVPRPVGLTITPTAARLRQGTTIQLTAQLTMAGVQPMAPPPPLDCTRAADWISSNPAEIAVDGTGLVSLVGAPAVGVNATITCRRGLLTDSFVITVAAQTDAGGVLVPFVPPQVSVAWRPFNNGLPLALVTDIATAAGTRMLRAATFGRGIWDCDLDGFPQRRLYIRQTVIEDGSTYLRAIPPAPSPPGAPSPLLNDPRLPQTGDGRVALDLTHAFDVRVDAPPYAFFDEVVDGVEFDQQLEVSDPVPTEDNYVYVQVHNAGTLSVPGVSVHLYAAECAAGDVVKPIGADATPSPASLDDAGALIADFYSPPNFDPITASKWKRVDAVRVVGDVPPDAPRVARFTWTPDAALATKNVALLALCSGHLDALPAEPAKPKLSEFILAERRAVLRIVHVAARPAASLYIRDGIAGDTRVGGYPVGGRSPDIMVVHPDIGGTADDTFKDFMARRAKDTVSGTETNVIYVRVHNRRRFETKAKVKVFAIGLDDANATGIDPKPGAGPKPDPWKNELPSKTSFADVTVPPSGVGYARVVFDHAPKPNVSGINKTYLLVALIKSEEDTDPLPNKDGVASTEAFWDLVSRAVDSDNAAARAVPWVP